MKRRDEGLDFLKLICAFLVVCIHIPFPETINKFFSPLTRIAVPIFFMITGYYYSSILECGKVKNQINKIFKLFIIANIIYVFFDLAKTLLNGNQFGHWLENTFGWKKLAIFLAFNVSPFASHLWYLGAILYVLILVYFFEKKLDRKYLYCLIPVLLLFDLVFGSYALVFQGKSFPTALVRNFLFVGLPYFLIGDCLKKFTTKIKAKCLVLSIILFSVLSITESMLLVHFGLNNIQRSHYLSTTFLTIAVFLFALYHGNDITGRIFRCCAALGREASLIIYIVHVIIIYACRVLVNVLNIRFILKLWSYTAPFIVFGLSIIVAICFKYIKRVLLKIEVK